MTDKKALHKKAIHLLEQKETILSLFKGIDDRYVKEMSVEIDKEYDKVVEEIYAETEEFENGHEENEASERWVSDQEERELLSDR